MPLWGFYLSSISWMNGVFRLGVRGPKPNFTFGGRNIFPEKNFRVTSSNDSSTWPLPTVKFWRKSEAKFYRNGGLQFLGPDNWPIWGPRWNLYISTPAQRRGALSGHPLGDGRLERLMSMEVHQPPKILYKEVQTLVQIWHHSDICKENRVIKHLTVAAWRQNRDIVWLAPPL